MIYICGNTFFSKTLLEVMRYENDKENFFGSQGLLYEDFINGAIKYVDRKRINDEYETIAILGKTPAIDEEYDCIAHGFLDPALRNNIQFSKYQEWDFATFVSKNAKFFCELENIVSPGQQIMPNAIIFDSYIQEGCYIGFNTIVNINSYIGRCCYIGDNVVVGENVRIGKNTFIESGTIIMPNVNIGDNCTVFHSVITKDIKDNGYAK